MFWDRCRYRTFFWPVSSFWVRAVRKTKKKLVEKISCPSCQFDLGKSTLWDFFRSFFCAAFFLRKITIMASVLFPCLRAAPWFCWCSRLASLAQSSLGPAQYRRWAFIQLCISELIIADPFCYHIISLPSSTYIYVVRLTLPGNRSIQALRVFDYNGCRSPPAAG